MSDILTLPPEPAPAAVADEFEKEMAEQGAAAKIEQPVQQPNNGLESDFEQAPPPDAPPMFSDSEDDEDQQANEPKKLNKEKTGMTVDMFLRAKNILTAEILKMVAKADNPDKYMLDEEQIEFLAKLYAPYAEQYGGYIPDWLWLLVGEAMTTGRKVVFAFTDRKINVRNEAMKGMGKVANTIAKAYQADLPARKNWKIDKMGYYVNDVYGTYVKVAERVEKASIEDLENICEYNSIDVIKQAFGIDDNYLRSKGIEID